MMRLRSFLFAFLILSGCAADPSENQPDAGMDGPMDGQPDGKTDDTLDASVSDLYRPLCPDEPNADVVRTPFATCESTCKSGFARCGDDCVTETSMQCGAGCLKCLTPANGAATCSDGVCGATCNAGYVVCNTSSGPSCCEYASELVAPVEFGGYTPSVAVDAAGKLHLAYYRLAENQLMYAFETPSGLVREPARFYWSSGGGAQFKLALGSRGPLLVYTYPNLGSGLWFAERRTTGWSHVKLLPDLSANGFGFATDRAGRAHLCFTSLDGGLGYAIRKGDRWTIAMIGSETDAKGACAVAVDQEGIPHIAFHRVTAGDLVYAKGSAAGTFTFTVVDTAGTVGSQLAITVTPTGTPHIAAYRSDTQRLRHAELAAGMWSVVDVSTAHIGQSPGITINGDGQPVIGYWDQDKYRVGIASRAVSKTWSTLTLTDIASGTATVATAPDGSVWAATGDRDILAHNGKTGTWSSSVIDAFHKVTTGVALRHPSGKPTLVYAVSGDDNVASIEIASHAGGGWTRTQLGTPGSTAAVEVDGANHIHLAYQTGSSLSYASDQSGSFVIEPLAADAREAGIAVDGANVPQVAYVATVGMNYALMLAARGMGGWTTTTIGPAAPYGTYRYPVVRIVHNVVSLLWQDTIAKATVYASSADGYTKVTIESAATSGHDLYVSPAGVPHACLFRKTGASWPDLRYATRPMTTWSNELVSAPGTSVNDGLCALGADAGGLIGIARSVRYGAGLGALYLTMPGATPTHTRLQDDFYSGGLDLSIGANGFEVAATGRPYSGTGIDQNRVRWAHR